MALPSRPLTGEQIRAIIDAQKVVDDERVAMEMLLGAKWVDPSFGMPGYFHKIYRTIEGIMVYTHEKFYDKNGNEIENPWRTRKGAEGKRVSAQYPYRPTK